MNHIRFASVLQVFWSLIMLWDQMRVFCVVMYMCTHAIHDVSTEYCGKHLVVSVLENVKIEFKYCLREGENQFIQTHSDLAVDIRFHC